jgi:hypothetical protein
MKHYINIIFSLFILIFILGCSGIKSIPIESDCNQIEIVFKDFPKKLKHGECYSFSIKSKLKNEIFISIAGVTGSVSKEKDNTYSLAPLSKGVMTLRFAYVSEQTNKKEMLCFQTYKIY